MLSILLVFVVLFSSVGFGTDSTQMTFSDDFRFVAVVGVVVVGVVCCYPSFFSCWCLVIGCGYKGWK